MEEQRFTMEDELDIRFQPETEESAERPRQHSRRTESDGASRRHREKREEPEQAEEKSAGRWLYEWLQPLVLTFTVMTLILTFIAPVVGVVGPSMQDTLQSGDRLLTVRRWLCSEIRRGDIVIVRKESFDADPIVKRVIALAGETVDIDFDRGIVLVDGKILDEPYIRELTFLEEGQTFPMTVEEGCLFLMGDNRNHSSDSRDPALGTVDERYIIGRAEVLLFPGVEPWNNTRDFSRIGLLH